MHQQGAVVNCLVATDIHGKSVKNVKLDYVLEREKLASKSITLHNNMVLIITL